MLTALTNLRALDIVWMDEPDRRQYCCACEGPMQDYWGDGSGCPECNPEYYDYHLEEAFEDCYGGEFCGGDFDDDPFR